MDNRIKGIFFALLGLIACIALAQQVGEGNYLPAALIGVVGLAVGAVLLVFPRAPFDGSIIALGVAGVMITGKGYSYIGVGGIFYITEAVLLCALVAYVVRIVFKGNPILPTNPMAVPIALFIGYMFFHLYFDRKTYGFLAFRDACIVYYLGFFIIAYQLASDGNWRMQFKKLVLFAVVPAMLVMVVIRFNTGIIHSIQHALTFGGRSLFAPHVDASDHIFIAMVLFCYQSSLRSRRKWPYLLGYLLILLFIIIAARGTIYVALGIMFGFMLLAGQMRIFKVLIPAALVGVGLFFIAYSYSPDFQRSEKVDRIFDEFKSFAVVAEKDVSGKGANTANWRLEWWGWIWRKMHAGNPFYGMGFGADLVIGFYRDVMGSQLLTDQGSTRGAHNAFFTILGRQGYVGAALFLWIVGIQLYYFYKAAMMWRRLGPKLDPFFLYLQGALITFFCTTFFQYSWEGPYSALPFWTLSGFSYYLIDQYYKGKGEPEWGALEMGNLRLENGGLTEAGGQKSEGESKGQAASQHTKAGLPTQVGASNPTMTYDVSTTRAEGDVPIRRAPFRNHDT